VPTFSCSGSIFSVGPDGLVLSSIVVLHNVRCKSLGAAALWHASEGFCRDSSCTLSHPHLDVDQLASTFLQFNTFWEL
jgi:hypothetical protein